MDHSLQNLQVENEPTNDGHELLTSLTPVRWCARVGGWQGSVQDVEFLGTGVVSKDWRAVAEEGSAQAVEWASLTHRGA